MSKNGEQGKNLMDKVLGVLENFTPANLVDDSHVAEALQGPLMKQRQELTDAMQNLENNFKGENKSEKIPLNQDKAPFLGKNRSASRIFRLDNYSNK